MSRCIICNCVLSEQELTNKDPLTGDYTDQCFDCINEQEALMSDALDEREVLYVHNNIDTDSDDLDEWA